MAQLSSISGNAQDAFHYASYAAGSSRSTFSDRDLRSELPRSEVGQREATARELAFEALRLAVKYALRAELPGAAGYLCSPKALTRTIKRNAELLADAVEKHAAAHGWDAYSDQSLAAVDEREAEYAQARGDASLAEIRHAWDVLAKSPWQPEVPYVVAARDLIHLFGEKAFWLKVAEHRRISKHA